MQQPFDLDQIRAYWTSQARDHGQSPAASWSDQMVIDMEIREICKHLEDGQRVLDVGCANGYSTIQFACQKQSAFRGLDYIPEMVEQARIRHKQYQPQLKGVVEFDVGDIMNLNEPSGSYDCVIVIRVLINLGQRERQFEAIESCARVLKPGGTLLLSEATLQGWSQLNRLRQEWQLPDIPMPPFNLYLDQDEVISASRKHFELIDIGDFASTYYVGTRLLKPLLIRALGANIDVADPNMHWNRWFAHLPPAGDYGTQKLFVLQRRDG
jgi:SAM-dependent methyltransferase